MRIAEDRGFDPLLSDLPFQVLVVQPPDSVFIPVQRIVYDPVAVVFQYMGEPDIGRTLHKHVVTLGAQHIQRGDHAAQHTVFIADMFPLQAGNSVVLLMPADDSTVIIIRDRIVAEGRMLCPPDDRVLD